MFAFGQIDVIVDLIGIEVKAEFARGMKSSLKVGDTADVY